MWPFSIKERRGRRGKGRPQRAAAPAGSKASALGASIFICHQHRKETPRRAAALKERELRSAREGAQSCCPGQSVGEKRLSVLSEQGKQRPGAGLASRFGRPGLRPMQEEQP